MATELTFQKYNTLPFIHGSKYSKRRVSSSLAISNKEDITCGDTIFLSGRNLYKALQFMK